MAGTWTYDPTLLGTDKLMQVRTLIADTNPNDQQLFNEQVNFAIAQNGSEIYASAADCCRQLAARYSRDVDTVQGELHRLYSARQKAYSARAAELDSRARLVGAGLPIAGGLTISDKAAQENNSNRVQPQFNVGMMDNFIPVAPVGNETPASGNPNGAW